MKYVSPITHIEHEVSPEIFAELHQMITWNANCMAGAVEMRRQIEALEEIVGVPEHLNG